MRLPLKLLTKLSALASIPFFFIFLAMGILTIQVAPLMQVLELPPELSLFIKATVLFYLVGGLFGWAALFAGYRNLYRPTDEVPKWIFWGMGVGVVAFFSQGPAGIVVGFPPLVLAACLVEQFNQNRPINVRHQAMNPVVKALIALIIGWVLGLGLLLGFCSIPGLKLGVACGHNAFIWLPLFILLGIYVCWLTLGVISRRRRKKTETENGVGKNA